MVSIKKHPVWFVVFPCIFKRICAAVDADLPPISVGASVDKMFAIGCRPYKQRRVGF
jgi:hypothetical protein